MEPDAGLPDAGLPCRDSGSLKFMTPTRQPPVRVLHDGLSECQCTLDRVWHISHDAGESIRRLGLPFGHNNLGLADFLLNLGLEKRICLRSYVSALQS